uniref:Uncharacterized protein n=1 Tax=Rhizophora mucronata TaxID=61149 RepID=A0A2P2QSZ7_RHIMU
MDCYGRQQMTLDGCYWRLHDFFQRVRDQIPFFLSIDLPLLDQFVQILGIHKFC